MILLGQKTENKYNLINNQITSTTDRIFVLSNSFIGEFNIPFEVVSYKQLIEYAYYYRIIEETTQNTLIVIDEPLFTSNRSDLTYNCIRVFLNSTKHTLIFSYLPISNEAKDLAILLDFDTQSKYKYIEFESFPMDKPKIKSIKIDYTFKFDRVITSEKDKLEYEDIKNKIISNLGNKKPDVIPRELQLKASKFKKHKITDGIYLFRNGRYKIKNSSTFRKIQSDKQHVIFDMPFSISDLIRFLKTTYQTEVTFLTSDLKIDLYFENKMKTFKKELDYAYSKI